MMIVISLKVNYDISNCKYNYYLMHELLGKNKLTSVQLYCLKRLLYLSQNDY